MLKTLLFFKVTEEKCFTALIAINTLCLSLCLSVSLSLSLSVSLSLSLSSLCCHLQVKCYHRRAQTADRDTVFRLQFHTCTVHGAQLWFGKSELDEACTGEFEKEERRRKING